MNQHMVAEFDRIPPRPFGSGIRQNSAVPSRYPKTGAKARERSDLAVQASRNASSTVAEFVRIPPSHVAEVLRLPLRLVRTSILGIALFASLAGPLVADERDQAPPFGNFPSPGTGHQFLGELFDVDPINRRGLLRPGGEVRPDRYTRFLGQPFALLPYGMVRYHGAPAELRDVPLGTVLHGTFYRPPEGDKSIPRPSPRDNVERQRAAYFVEHTHALLLEDDVSFYERQGQAWKIESLGANEAGDERTLVVDAVGTQAPSGLAGRQTFSIDKSTRVWKGKEFASLDDLVAGQTVQFNLTWSPNWGYGKFHVADIWLDQESLNVAAETQRQIHIRYQRYHWLPAWIDAVTHEAEGRGTVTVTLFGGMDPSLYEEIVESREVSIAVAEPTLRTWRKDQDHQTGPLVNVRNVPDAPLGSSGIEIRIEVKAMLEGFRPGRIVRVGCPSFPKSVLPPEERINDLKDRDQVFSRSSPKSLKN